MMMAKMMVMVVMRLC